ncbi:hypothetical protein LY76DRAFT_60304 [Colletotrichum caudatum]|nr:hypothetical protein LY76DRAFT_60304 [Colletotrichum caudatum]
MSQPHYQDQIPLRLLHPSRTNPLVFGWFCLALFLVFWLRDIWAAAPEDEPGISGLVGTPQVASRTTHPTSSWSDSPNSPLDSFRNTHVPNLFWTAQHNVPPSMVYTT